MRGRSTLIKQEGGGRGKGSVQAEKEGGQQKMKSE